MQPLQIGKFYNDEVAGHCRRVATLCRRVASVLSLLDPLTKALEIAAVLHECPAPFLRPDDLNAILRATLPPGDIFPSPDCVVEASHILAVAARVSAPVDEGTELAAELLGACNAFDEAVEFAAFDRVSLPEAIDAFQRELGAAFRPAVTSALQFATAPVAPVHRSGRLPVLPRAAMQLMRTSEETASPAQLHLIAASDPVLCASLLHVANSARFGGREPVSRVVEAAARVGVPMARRVLLAACLAPLFASKPLRDLWDHSRRIADAVSEAARGLSSRRDMLDPDKAYTAGLLHDIGSLIFESGPASASAALVEWRSDGFPQVCAETLTYGQDHASAGAHLLREWNLPPAIVNAVEYHHRPEQSDSVLASLLFLAEEWSGGEPGHLSANMRRAFAEKHAGLTLDVFDRLQRDAGARGLALAG
jgi:putative nucleotidyltransferase with HDIG domain